MSIPSLEKKKHQAVNHNRVSFVLVVLPCSDRTRLAEEMVDSGWMTLTVQEKRSLSIAVPTDHGAETTAYHLIKLVWSVKGI